MGIDRAWCLVFAALVFVSSARGQPLRIIGNVRDSADALPNVNVMLRAVGLSTMTDSIGNYSLVVPAEKVQSQSVVITVSRMDYQLLNDTVTLAGATAHRDFVLSKRIYSGHAAALDPGIVRAAGLPDLRTGRHRKGEREIRIFIDGGYLLPYPLYRFVNRHGTITGEVIRYMPLEGPGSQYAGSKGHSASAHDWCAMTESKAFFPCRARFTEQPDWRRLFDSMDSLDVWNIADEGTLHKRMNIVFDGSDITAEMWDGNSYKAWAYAPGVEDSEAGRAKVSFISHLLREVDSLIAY